MAGEAQQRFRSTRLQGLGVMGLINEQDRTGLRKLSGEPRPADEINRLRQHIRLTLPMGMQTRRSHNQHPEVRAAGHGPRRQQSRQGFAQTHLVRQHGTAACQQPTGARPLMRQRSTTILKRIIQIGGSNQIPVCRQRRQRLTAPGQPLLQIRSDRETGPQRLLKGSDGRQRKLPTLALAAPASPGLDATQLRLGHGIKRAHHLDHSRW